MMRLSSAGLGVSVTAALLALVGYLSRDNLLLAFASVSVATLLVDGFFGWWQLRGAGVQRVLPSFLFAERDARGALVVHGGRAGLHQVVVEDLHGAAVVRVVRLAAGASARLDAWWRFATRGRAELGAVVLSSQWPLGLWSHQRVIELPEQLWVAPTPRGSVTQGAQPGWGEGEASQRAHVAGSLELASIRPFMQGDPRRAVHARTSARARRPMVVLRALPERDGVVIAVPDVGGSDWERALEAAAAGVREAVRAGRPVGLRLPGAEPTLAAAQRGEGWACGLLDALARAERRPW